MKRTHAVCVRRRWAGRSARRNVGHQWAPEAAARLLRQPSPAAGIPAEGRPEEAGLRRRHRGRAGAQVSGSRARGRENGLPAVMIGTPTSRSRSVEPPTGPRRINIMLQSAPLMRRATEGRGA